MNNKRKKEPSPKRAITRLATESPQVDYEIIERNGDEQYHDNKETSHFYASVRALLKRKDRKRS
jgi:hypothetical protein